MNNLDLVVSKNSFILKKPWGYEIVLVPANSPVSTKILHINAGCRFSLQYHEVKEESLVLINGEAKIIFGKNENELVEEVMQKNVGYFIPSGVVHRCSAISECDIFESSTKEEGTTVRLQDDYSRKDETEEERNKNRT